MNAAYRYDDPIGRRMLMAVSFVDVVNYSAQMAADEAGTHARWMAALSDIVRPKTTDHGGSIVKSTGDGVLARFGSALDAVEWAEEVQRAVQNLDEAEAARLELRISVHLGDVITTVDDIFGDGVNVAARLLEHAAPGGVVLSEAVYDMVRGSAGARAVDLGLRSLKSYERPVRIYHLAPERPGALRRSAISSSVPSIAILPLSNLNGDSEDVYFADGIVEDIVQSLAGLGDLLVISSGSTRALGGQSIDPREAGKLLGVRYVLMGSLRRLPHSVRVRVQFCDASDGTAIWVESAEAGRNTLFDTQDRIVEKVVAGIAPNVRSSELRKALRKRPESFSAYDHMLRGLHLIHSLNDGEFDVALRCLHAAVADDPYFAMPFAWIAYWHATNIGQGRTTHVDHDLTQAGLMAARAIDLDGSNSLALAMYGHVKSFLFHDYDLGLVYLERAVAAGPNNAQAQLYFAASLAYTGQSARAVQHAEHGLRLSPMDRSLFYTQNILCLSHYGNKTFKDAVKWGRLSHAGNPMFTATHRLLTASLVADGLLDEAREIGKRMMLIEPDFRVGVWELHRQPFRDKTIGETYAERLVAAGLPR